MLSLFCMVVCVLAQLINNAVHPAAILVRKRRVVDFIGMILQCYRIRPSFAILGAKKGKRKKENGAYGISDIEGKVAMVATSEHGKRVSFN